MLELVLKLELVIALRGRIPAHLVMARVRVRVRVRGRVRVRVRVRVRARVRVRVGLGLGLGFRDIRVRFRGGVRAHQAEHAAQLLVVLHAACALRHLLLG